MIKKHILFFGLAVSLNARCPPIMHKSDLIKIDQSGKKCLVTSEKELNDCVKDFKYNFFILNIYYASKALIVLNDSIAFLNVNWPINDAVDDNGNFLCKPSDAVNYCVDKNGINQVEYEVNP